MNPQTEFPLLLGLASCGALVIGLGLWRAGCRRAAAMVEQLDELKGRLHAQRVELEQVQAEFEQLLSLKDDFLGTVSHQLRTPLTPIMEGLELLRDGVNGTLSKEQLGLVWMMDGNAKRLADLVNDILDLRFLKSGRRLLTRRPSDLAALLSQAKDTWQAADASHALRLRHEGLPEVYMDAQAIRDVLDQLLRNALRHALAQTEVIIEAVERGNMVEVSVEDCGAGLSAEQVAQLFQPFVHLQAPHAPGSQGSGLGLAFCRQMIERHRGSIQAQSHVGQGTRVTLTLPVVTEVFLLEEACRCASEEAQDERGTFALLLFALPDAAFAPSVATQMLKRTEAVLRRHTHHGDRFVRLQGDAQLAIVAVTDEAGAQAMAQRLRGVLERAGVELGIASALCPIDGESAQALLEAAQRRLKSLRKTSGETVPA